MRKVICQAEQALFEIERLCNHQIDHETDPPSTPDVQVLEQIHGIAVAALDDVGLLTFNEKGEAVRI